MSITAALRSQTASSQEWSSETVARSASTNPYVKLEQWRPWDATLLDPYAEYSTRSLCSNGFHVIIGQRRVFLVGKNGSPFSLPPFGSAVHDVCVDVIDENKLILVVAVDDGMHVSLLHHLCAKEGGPAVADSSFVSTRTPVARIHRMKERMFALCHRDSLAQTLRVHMPHTSTGCSTGLGIVLHAASQSWMGMARQLFRRRTHQDSFFDSSCGRLVVLTMDSIAIWEVKGDDELHVSYTASAGPDAVAVLPPLGRMTVGTVVRRCGTLDDLILSDGTCSMLTVVRGYRLPDSMKATSICQACRGADTTVLYDDRTITIIVIAHNAVVLSNDSSNSYLANVASPVNLAERLCGLGFMGSVAMSEGRGFIWLYGRRQPILCLERNSVGSILLPYAESSYERRRVLATLDPLLRVEVILKAALDGVPMHAVATDLRDMLMPSLVDANTMQLSVGAIGLVRFLMREVGELSRLCTSYDIGSQNFEGARCRVLQCCGTLRGVLNEGGWLDSASEDSFKWHGFLGRSPQILEQHTALNAQAKYLSAVLEVAERVATIVWLFSMLVDATTPPWTNATLERVLWESDDDAIATDYVTRILCTDDRTVVGRLRHESHRLPLKARLIIELHDLLPDGEAALGYAQQRLMDIVRCDLLRYTTNVLESEVPHLAPRIRLLRTYYRHDPTVSSTIIAVLKDLPASSESLRRAVTCLFDHDTAPDLQAVVRDWMEGHALDDARMPLFASVLAETGAPMGTSHTLAGRFFQGWCDEVRGNALSAARRFGELSRIKEEASLSARLLCVQHAMQCAPNDDDKMTEFVLLLQRQLVELLQRHLQSATPTLVRAAADVEADLRYLSLHCLDERTLFEEAGRYRELGGASVQLDILKIHADSPESVVSDVLYAMLTFLKAVGLSCFDAVERVLREYLHTFQASLPIYPMVLFMAFDKAGTADIVTHLLACEVPPAVLFDTLLRFIDGRGEVVFPIPDILNALVNTVSSIPAAQHHVCIVHLLECIRGVLAGEYRSVSLSAEDVFSVKAIEASLKRMPHRQD